VASCEKIMRTRVENSQREASSGQCERERKCPEARAITNLAALLTLSFAFASAREIENSATLF
jgi:hypothetical protein